MAYSSSFLCSVHPQYGCLLLELSLRCCGHYFSTCQDLAWKCSSHASYLQGPGLQHCCRVPMSHTKTAFLGHSGESSFLILRSELLQRCSEVSRSNVHQPAQDIATQKSPAVTVLVLWRNVGGWSCEGGDHALCRYAAGATIQILLFGILAIEVKRKAPTAHTVLEIISESPLIHRRVP